MKILFRDHHATKIKSLKDVFNFVLIKTTTWSNKTMRKRRINERNKRVNNGRKNMKEKNKIEEESEVSLLG